MDLTNNIDLENITTKWIQIISSINIDIFCFTVFQKMRKLFKGSLREGDSIIEKNEINKKRFRNI